MRKDKQKHGTIALYEDPQAMEAIRFYTDPLLPTWGNKTASAAAAGYDSATVFNRLAVREKVEEIVAEREAASRDVIQFLGTYTIDAARELIRQLSTGRDLELVDPTPLFDDGPIEEVVDALQAKIESGADQEVLYAVAKGLAEGRARKAEAMIKHNNSSINASKERRNAAIEILRQQIGTPEQRISVKKEEARTPLSDMDDGGLEELNKIIAEELKARQPQVIPEADVTIVE